ncbi:MAG: branched-chain amino acid ABC transporter permease [Candidatus Rokubacteria bacterium]|nr:branched-chain amino acid ABC transporter permease [Candidatus Rokubacteria bacterium]MBI3106378.1 branched-chain amino acid ABC transporter permease [Candidatus Rokubacteria bacterium]
MMWEPVLWGQLLINGVMLAGLYGLLALGLNLVFGVMRVINFAHGELVMLGAFVTFWGYTAFGLHPLLALPLSALALFALGWVLQRLLLERVLGGPPMAGLLVTFGLSLVVINVGLLVFGADIRSIPVVTGSLPLGGFVVPRARGLAFLVAVTLTGLTVAFLKWSALGRAIRATAQHPEVAITCGVDVRRTRLVTFGLGAALGSAAGSLLMVILPMDPQSGSFLILKAFAVIIIGGLGSVAGGLLGALVLGVAEVFGAFFFSTVFGEVVAYVLLLLVLLVRPAGLLGVAER